MTRNTVITTLLATLIVAVAGTASAKDEKAYAGETCRPLGKAAPVPTADLPTTYFTCPVVNDSLGEGILYARVWRHTNYMRSNARCTLTRSAPGNAGWASASRSAGLDGVFRFGALPRYSSDDRYVLVCQGRPAKYFVVEG